jgi:hypothetical protein
MSKDVFGVEVADATVVVAFDFRLAGGKYPKARRGTRNISTGALIPGSTTQESCLKSISSDEEVIRDNGSEVYTEGIVAFVGPSGDNESPPFEAELVRVANLSGPGSNRSFVRYGLSTFLPLAAHPSSGTRTCVLVWMLSFGQNRLIFRKGSA